MTPGNRPPFSDAGNAVFPPEGARIDVVRPADEEGLRAALRAAHQASIPVTLSAALTGLAGGSVPRESGLRLDLTGLSFLPDRAGYRRITPFLLLSERDPCRGLVAPGVALRELNRALDALDLWYPPHPGEDRSTLGGNVATNASGPRTFSHGSTRDYVTSLRVVLADGDVIALERGRVRTAGRRFAVRTETGRLIEGEVPGYAAPAVKNAAGLHAASDMDLVDLFVGSEGILGAVAEVGLRFLPRRALRAELFLFADAAEALEFVDALRPLKAVPGSGAAAAGVVSLEWFDAGALALAREAGHDVVPEAVAAVETEFFADDEATRVKIILLADRLRCRGTLPPGEVAAFRYAVPRRVAELLKSRGQPKFGTDFAVPVARFRELYAFYEETGREFAAGRPGVRTAKWGHVGDCHLHLNFLCEDDADQARARSAYLRLVRKAVALGGTVSAEHGTGKKTLADEDGVARPYLWYLYGDEGLRRIAAVKRAFDPRGLLNRGNMIPADAADVSSTSPTPPA